MRGFFGKMAAIMAVCGPVSSMAVAQTDRTVLPLAEPPRQVSTELDVRNATPPPRFEVKAPEGAPNVLLILIDDLGLLPGAPCTRAELAKWLVQQRLAGSRLIITLSAGWLPANEPQDPLAEFVLSGGIRRLRKPGLFARMKILKSRARELGLRLPALQLVKLGLTGSSHAGELRGVVNGLNAHARWRYCRGAH